MRRLALVLIVAGLLCLAQAGSAADLLSTWYINLYQPGIFVYDQYNQPILIGDGHFYNTPAGQYGPFQVADPYGDSLELKITIPHSVSSIGAAQSLVIPLSVGLDSGTRIAYFSLAGVTSYDPTQMYLGLYRINSDGTTQTLWTQQQDGVRSIAGHVAYDITTGGQFYFKVNVVPEPSTLLCVLFGCATLAPLVRRRFL